METKRSANFDYFQASSCQMPEPYSKFGQEAYAAVYCPALLPASESLGLHEGIQSGKSTLDSDAAQEQKRL